MLEDFKIKPGKLWLWVIIVVEILGGALLIVGLYTQVAALALSILLTLAIIAVRKNKRVFDLSLDFLSMLLLITLSLMFLGPGFYSIDLPL